MTVSNSALLNVTVNRKQMAKIYGGGFLPMCVRTAGRDFLYPKTSLNPFLPPRPGAPGLLYRGNNELQWKGDLQTLFVAERDGEYRYRGQYKLTPSTSLSKEEYVALPQKVGVRLLP